jgi:hypothetical protein
MDKHGTLGKLGDLGGKATSVIGDEVKNIAKTVKSQVTGLEEVGTEKSKTHQASEQSVAAQLNQPSREQNQELVKEIYGIQKDGVIPSKEQAEEKSKISKTKDEQKLQELRALAQRLHKDTYYDPLVERAKPQEEEERAQERVERQEEEEEKKDWLKEQEEKKKAPVAVSRAQRTTEMGKTSG